VFTVEMLAARHGDALWIEYGDDEAAPPHRILIDGGTEGTRAVLEERIGALPAEERTFELLIVSHIDSDHIGGILRLLEEAEVEVAFRDVWFNGWRHLPETPLESLGPVQGERLTNSLLGPPARPWNLAFGSGPVSIPDGAGILSPITLPGGLELTVLAPGRNELWALKQEWRTVLQEAGIDPSLAPPAEPESPAMGGLERLGPPPPLPDVEALAAPETAIDHAEANGSSIVVLAEFGGRRALLTGDAHPDVFVRGIDRMAGADSTLDVDLFKLPHHGSRANVTKELLKRVRCGRYLFSTDGSRFGHPDQEAVARVLTAGAPTELHFNYLTQRNEIWGDPRLTEAFGYTAVFRGEAERMIVPV
jgi:Metallo-beta-lactamase superfamily